MPHLSADTIPAYLFGAFQVPSLPTVIYLVLLIHLIGILILFCQCMFALMVPVIVTGSWAEKFSFEAFLGFVILWPIFVYYPLAHWIWNADGYRPYPIRPYPAYLLA